MNSWWCLLIFAPYLNIPDLNSWEMLHVWVGYFRTSGTLYLNFSFLHVCSSSFWFMDSSFVLWYWSCFPFLMFPVFVVVMIVHFHLQLYVFSFSDNVQFGSGVGVGKAFFPIYVLTIWYRIWISIVNCIHSPWERNKSVHSGESSVSAMPIDGTLIVPIKLILPDCVRLILFEFILHIFRTSIISLAYQVLPATQSHLRDFTLAENTEDCHMFLNAAFKIHQQLNRNYYMATIR